MKLKKIIYKNYFALLPIVAIVSSKFFYFNLLYLFLMVPIFGFKQFLDLVIFFTLKIK